MDRYAVVVVDLATGEPTKLPERFLGDHGRDEAHRAAARRSDDVNERAWVVVLHPG